MLYNGKDFRMKIFLTNFRDNSFFHFIAVSTLFIPYMILKNSKQCHFIEHNDSIIFANIKIQAFSVVFNILQMFLTRFE